VDIPSPCPVCGAYSLAPGERTTILLAVCDVLTLKALEALGKYIVRAGARNRYELLRPRPLTLAHTIWPAGDAMVDKALRGAWDVVPAVMSLYGCCDLTTEHVVCTLDEYVHDLAVTGERHKIDHLAYRFDTRLGLPTREAVWT
jgi:hypothetical protein